MTVEAVGLDDEYREQTFETLLGAHTAGTLSIVLQATPDLHASPKGDTVGGKTKIQPASNISKYVGSEIRALAASALAMNSTTDEMAEYAANLVNT